MNRLIPRNTARTSLYLLALAATSTACLSEPTEPAAGSWQQAARATPEQCYLVEDVLDSGGDDILFVVNKNDPNPATNLVQVGVLGQGIVDVEAIALDPRTDILFASDADQLGTVDVDTGLFTALPQPFGTGQGAEGDIDFDDVDGLSFDPSTGELYGSVRRRPGADLLIRIDAVTGAHIPDAFGTSIDYVVLDVAGKDDIDALATDIDGVLYAIATDDDDGLPDQLATIDKTTGQGTVVGTDLGVDNVEGMGFDTEGQLWGTAGDDDSKQLFRISKTTGTTIGTPVDLEQNRDFESIDCLTGALPGEVDAGPGPGPDAGPGTCGNGNLEAGEGCDDGNVTGGDGCNATCRIESIEEVGDCLIGDCTAPPGDCTPGSANCPRCNDDDDGLTGDDSCASGFCSEVGGIAVCTDCGNGQVEDREGCDNPGRADNSECTATCQVKSCPTGDTCDQTCTITPGTPSDPTCHTCTDDDHCVSSDCQGEEDGRGICVGQPECGNGNLEPGEGCDDGNTTDDDGCNASCRIESIEEIGDCRLGDCPDPVTCTPGSPNCAACNTMSPGAIGDASCESGFCNADGFCQDCGDGNLDGFEGCDDTNNTGADGCSATCLIESCPEGQSCPADPECTPGSPGCNVCNDDPAGATGDASCESDYCDPSTNTCGLRPPRLGGGGCSATTADAGFGLGLMLVLVMGWLYRRRRALGAIAILAGAMAFPQLARAQEDDSRNFSAERFKLSSDRDGILDVESGTVIGHLNWDLGFWLGYADDPLALYMADGDERIDSFLTRRIGGELVAALGFGKRLQLGVQIPVILDQNYTYMDAALEPESTTGLGDVSIHPKLQLLFARSHGVDLAIIPAFTLPSRGSESYFGDVSLSFAPMLALSRQMNRLGLGANFGYRLRYNTPEVLGLEVADEAFARLGASYRLNSDAEKPLDLGVSVSLSTAAADFFGLFNRNHAESLLGANYQVTSDWNLFGGGGIGLNPGFGTPDWRVLGGLRFTKRPLVCEQPLVSRNGRCVKDCDAPYVERDGQCVLPPCQEGYDRVGTECVLQIRCDGNPPNKDADCDTLPAPPWIQLGPPDDAYDKNRTEPRTPGEPVDPTGYKFGDTVPVEDGQEDFPESVNQYDYCPTVPGKVEHHGCPPPSVVAGECAEGRGRGAITVGPDITFLPDSAVLTLPSRVPLEELARVVTRDPDLLVAINVGGPRANRDLAQRRADAIAAFLQKNGIKTDNVSIIGSGAPESTTADDPADYPVSFERRCPANLPPTTLCKNIELGDDYKIEFEVNSDKIRPASQEMLKRDVQWLLQAHPQVRVDVQGHTSGEGKLEYNMTLSRRRAQAVVDYLVSQGIAADRLTAVGHGPKIPLVSPERTEADREKNRRIEFSIRPRKECNTCTRFEVGKIQFEFNSGVIKAESFPELDSVVRKLLANPEVHLLIEGHTSSEGAANYNRRLSATRAAAVRKYLVEKGVAASRLASKGVGEDRLLIPNDTTEEQRETNRRVEFTITRGKPECPE